MQHDLALGILISTLLISLIIVFCVILIRVYFTKIQRYTKLIYQKDIDFQIALNSTIVETQEQVLTNISRDLHDDAGQQLTYINFQLENLKLDSDAMKLALDPLSESVTGLSESIRSISHALNNQLLMQQDLIKAIEGEIARLQKNSAIAIVTDIRNETRDFTTNEKIVVYRIFQEITNNIFKHSKATQVNIQIDTNPLFVMTVSDKGKGFDTDTKGKQTMGLQTMSQRASIIGYSIAIRSAPGKGTTITLSEQQKK